MSTIIDRRTDFSDLISPMRDNDEPVYNWHAFKHSYSRELVLKLAEEFGLQKGAWVMDPFCGGGTTLLALRELGINSHGYDILPFSVFLSNVKTRNYDYPELLEVRGRFRVRKTISIDIPGLEQVPIAKKAFTPRVKEELVRLKQWIEEIEDPVCRDFYNLALLNIVESVSKTSKAGGFLRFRRSVVRPQSVQRAFLRRADAMIRDVRQFHENLRWTNTRSEAFLADARRLETSKSYDAIITSPPYPNRHDYSRIYSLEMLFDFVKSNDELKAIRYQTLRSHVEARKRFACNEYSKSARLTRLLREIENNGTNNCRVVSMLEGYFEDMYIALKGWIRSLRKGGHIALVVSNVRFAGVSVPVDELLAEVGDSAGLTTKAIYVARLRGNSPQQMKRYSRVPSRESIVIWEK